MEKKESIIKSIILVLNIVVFYYLVFVGRNQYLHEMNYLICVLFMLFNSIFIFCYGILRNNKKTYDSNILLYIFLFSYLLFTFTFIISRDTFRFYNWWYTGQYRPFYTIISQFKYGSFVSIMKNILGNCVALVPLSFLLMVKDKKFNNVFKQSLIILPVILCIEILQAFTHTGIFDIDDIILNYLGIVIFTFLITRVHIIDKIRNLFYMDFKLNNKTKRILFYISLTIVILIDIFLLVK